MVDQLHEFILQKFQSVQTEIKESKIEIKKRTG